MIYLTYNDQPSGVYSSQVIDVCHYLNSEFNADVKLVAFISIRQFFRNRSILRKEFPGACVLPALPTARHWRCSIPVFAIICLLTGRKHVISRNVLATIIAHNAKRIGFLKSVIFDGRGAIAAEWNEYRVVEDERMKSQIGAQERRAILNSDFRISVSEKLVDYWRTEYGYKSNDHVVIPCTLGSGFIPGLPPENAIMQYRQEQGFIADDIILVYSGSTAGWQSFGSLSDILGTALSKNQKVKLLFLAKEDENINEMISRYPGQVFNKWLDHKEVQKVLYACDYGILYRDQSVTNKVAAPTKFAEYLASGLSIIISNNLGDYSDFVKREQCGIIPENETISGLETQSYIQKIRHVALAEKHFTKKSHHSSYQKLITKLKLK